MRKYKAFTLAEVLLVLAIIGVIAAVTIPATMQQSAEKKFSTLAKKSVSTLQNAIDLKMTYVPTRPINHNSSLFQWLTNGEQFGYDTLKVVDSNNNMSRVQTADGMVIESGTWGCTNPTRANKVGCDFWFYIDLNGAEGPTRSTATGGIPGGNANREYDVIFYTLEGNGEVSFRGGYSGGTNVTTRQSRAQKYLGRNN